MAKSRGQDWSRGTGFAIDSHARRATSCLLQFSGVLVILIAAAAFRFSGLDWDRGYLFHPDERKILLVASGLQMPANLQQFLSPDSPLNPKFFAYGSFPIYLLRALQFFAPPAPYPTPWQDGSLFGLALLGRTLSGLFDLGTIVLAFALARRLYGWRVGLIAVACIAVTVLDIQLAHFYAVDTLLTFFVVATVYFAVRFAEAAGRSDAVLMGAAFGLAMATKVSAAPLVVPITVATLMGLRRRGVRLAPDLPDKPFAPRRWIATVRVLAAWVWLGRGTLARIFAVALAVFVVTQPYAVLDPVQYFGQTGTESLVARGWLDYPYTRQFASTIPVLYQVEQSSVWGMGLPLGILAWGGTAAFVWSTLREREWRGALILSWAAVYFVFIGVQYTKYLRYLLPLLPFLYIMAAAAVSRLAPRGVRTGAFGLALGAGLLYSIAFVPIYSHEHPWIQISEWIYRNVPASSSVAIEHWDDALPVSIPRAGADLAPIEYHEQVLPMFDADTPAKLQALVDALETNDYVVLASARLYATICRLPARYPISSRYYHALFDGRLGFDLAAFARDDPGLAGRVLADDPLDGTGLAMPPALESYFRQPGLLDWGRADESFSVYDHPMPLVFVKTRALSPDEIRAVLTSP